MRIINNVMKLQSGGEPKRVRYISAPGRNINRGIGDPDRVTSVGDEIAKAREWEANWYKGRKATVKDGEAIITANADPTYERQAASFGNTLESVLTHELDHAATIKDMNVWGQTQEEFNKNSIKSATPSLIKVNDIIGGGIFKGGSNDYINNAAEVKARLNSMRRDAKMDPARTDYKYKDYKYWLDKYGLNYGKEKSELLMNTVAQVQPTSSGTLFAQEGTVLRQDNTRVAKPVIPELIKAKPRQDQLIDLGGEPSTDTRTAAERNRDYWHPFKGAKERFKASMRNGTNPLVGLERTVMPAMAGAALVTTPATVVGGLLGSEAVNNATGGFGQWLEGKVGIPAEVGEYLNPGAVYGGGKGLNITKNKLVTKFIKGDADLGWNALNRNHWIFNREARTPTNMAMASINRVMPFLSNVEKTPARVAAYKVGRRTKGNASVSLKDIKNNDSTYTGSATPEGNNGDRDLLGLYLFQNDPLISRSPWFQRIAKSFKPAKGQGFNYDKRYSELYPGIEGDMVIEMPDGFQTFRQPGTNYVGPIDDVGGHVIKIDYNKKGKLTQISQDMWKFNPRDYAKRWSGDNVAEGVRATKQTALMDKVGTPFILQQENPIYIGSRRVWDSIKSIPRNPYIRRQPLMQGALLTMKKGGSLVSDGRRFKFKDSPLVRNSRTLNNKRDMRKKFMKSDRPTYSTNRVRKGQDGLQFVSYTPVETPDIPKFESSDVFSTYNIPIVRDESVVSQPRVDEPRVDEPIIESAVSTPMKRELFNIKPSKGLDEFNKWYDEVEKEDPEAKHYRQFLTKMAEQESGFNSAIQNRAGAPAYGYFQFMQDGKKYNNITAYAGTDIETFRNNPKLQIKAAIKLAKSFERGFNKKDLELAAQKGYTKFGLLGGAWLAGNGGVRKYLQGLANPSDRHWSKSGSGTDVASRIQMFNF